VWTSGLTVWVVRMKSILMYSAILYTEKFVETEMLHGVGSHVSLLHTSIYCNSIIIDNGFIIIVVNKLSVS